MKLSEIQAETDEVISVDERSHIRRILGVPEKSGNTYYDQSEDTFDAVSLRVTDGITALQEAKNIFLCRELRVLYKKYDKIGDDTTVIDGGRDGIKTSAKSNRLRFALQLWNRVFPPDTPVPNEDIFSEMADLRKPDLSSDSGTFIHVPVTYNDYEPDSEYSSG